MRLLEIEEVEGRRVLRYENLVVELCPQFEIHESFRITQTVSAQIVDDLSKADGIFLLTKRPRTETEKPWMYGALFTHFVGLQKVGCAVNHAQTQRVCRRPTPALREATLKRFKDHLRKRSITASMAFNPIIHYTN